MGTGICIHCHATSTEASRGAEAVAFFWDPTSFHPADRCTYGLGHEWPVAKVAATSGPKRDAKLCTKCGLHPRNPAATSNGCEHVYEAP